jgi:hypothetical protein
MPTLTPYIGSGGTKPKRLASTTDTTPPDSASLVAAIDQLIKSHITKGENFSIKPPTFSGRASDNFQHWEQQFAAHANFHKWDKTRKAQAFPLFLHNIAWDFYESLPATTKDDFSALTTAFREKFSTKDLRWVHEQSLYARQQGQTKSLESYLEDILSKFRLLNKSPAEQLGPFLHAWAEARPQTLCN